jgi:hypothetical protein
MQIFVKLQNYTTMKKLQINFTTPKQSKRLLELGVPFDSADCYNTTKHIGKIPESATYKDVWKMSKWRDKNDNHIEMYPCWSVGRLIEIYHICVSRGFSFNVCFPNLMNEIMYEFGEAHRNGWLNLSKLEDDENR